MSGRWPTIPAGRRDLARALTNQRSQSIGTGKLSPARGISKVSRDYQTPIRKTALFSRQDFPPRIVRLARCGPSAPKPSENPASLDCNRVSIMRRCKPPESIKRRKISNKATPHAQALREHMNRRSVAADCGDAAISGSRRHACSMSPPPSQSIWSGWTRGGPALQEQKRDAPTSRPCGGLPRVIANSPPVSLLGLGRQARVRRVFQLMSRLWPALSVTPIGLIR